MSLARKIHPQMGFSGGTPISAIPVTEMSLVSSIHPQTRFREGQGTGELSQPYMHTAPVNYKHEYSINDRRDKTVAR